MADQENVSRSTTLRLSEIFASLQGESTRVGLPTVFVRLTGCPLRCTWCDTAYAFKGGETVSLESVLEDVSSHGLNSVCVTGGEPLAQTACLPLLTALCDAGVGQGRAAELAEFDAGEAVLPGAKGFGDAFRCRQLGDMALAVGDGQGVGFKTLLAGDGQAGGGIQPARQQDDGAGR